MRIHSCSVRSLPVVASISAIGTMPMVALLAAVALSATIVTPGLARAGRTQSPVCGDVNDNGTVATSDALLVLKTAVGQPTDPKCYACPSLTTWGNSSQLPDEVHLADGYLLGSQVKILGLATVVRLGVISKQAGAHFKMALYTDDAGAPGNFVVGTEDLILAEGPQQLVVNPTPIEPGQYWLMAVYDVNSTVAGSNSGGIVRFRALTESDGFPAVFGASGSISGVSLNYDVTVVE